MHAVRSQETSGEMGEGMEGMGAGAGTGTGTGGNGPSSPVRHRMVRRAAFCLLRILSNVLSYGVGATLPYRLPPLLPQDSLDSPSRTGTHTVAKLQRSPIRCCTHPLE